MAKRASKEELTRLIRSGQIIRTSELLKILASFGFEHRQGGRGSHILIRNEQYPEIKPFTVVSNYKNVDTQRDALRLCVQILEWEEEAKAAGLKAVPQAAEEFETAAATNEIIIPEAYELVQGRNNPGKFLRHRRLPQIASELEDVINQALIDSKENYLNSRVEKLDEALRSATEDHDFEIETYPNGTIILMHPCHDVNLVLYPFTPRRENWTVISEVEKAIEDAQLSQLDSEDAFQAIAEYYFLEEQKRNRTEIIYALPNPFFRETKGLFTLKTTPNGNFSTSEMMSLVQEMETSVLQSLNRDLKERFGFRLRKVNDRQVSGSHILFDINFTIDTPDLFEIAEEQSDQVLRSEGEDRGKQKTQFIELLKMFKKRNNVLTKAVKDFVHNAQPIMARFKKIVNSTEKKGAVGKRVAGEIGKYRFRVHGQSHDLDVLFTKSQQGGNEFYPTKKTIETLERALAQPPFQISGFTQRTEFTKPSQKDQPLPIPPLTPFGK